MDTKEFFIPQDADFINCAQEAIHVPGSIQPHGVLFVLSNPQLEILQVSKNTFDFFELNPDDLINKNLSILFKDHQIDAIKDCLNQGDFSSSFNNLKLSFKGTHKNFLFDGILHQQEGGVILELESLNDQEKINLSSFYHLVKASIKKIIAASTLEDLCQVIAKEVLRITGFDRVMIYKFEADGHGIVIAEEKNDNLPTLLGLHYPALDIPPQARELYLANWLRLIVDINYQPVEITPMNNPITNSPLDLSFSVLRSVSPLHIEYLQNMGIAASMSISLIKEQKLWGLIVCHHQSPNYVPYEVRAACEFLGQTMSLEIPTKEQYEDYDYQLKLKSIESKIIESISGEINLTDALAKCQPSLLELVSAQGAFIVFGETFATLGQSPDGEVVKPLLNWLKTRFDQQVFVTESLPKLYPEAEGFKAVASGLLAICISEVQNQYVLWFRPEVVQTVNWGRNPYTILESQREKKGRFSPRKSFERWKEIVQGKSLPWKPCEIDAARELLDALIKIVLRQADELAKLNIALRESETREREKALQLEKTLQELQRTQTQLVQSEKMSSLGQLVAGIAHEINNPINFIYGNLSHATKYIEDILSLIQLYQQQYLHLTPSLMEMIERIELEYIQEDLPKILSSMQVGAERIREIVESLRNFSRLDESQLKQVDIHEGIESTLMILQNRLKAKPERSAISVIKEYRYSQVVECYPSLLNQVFINILTNAIEAIDEYHHQCKLQEIHPARGQIRIVTEAADPDLLRIKIADNGTGIPESMMPRLYDPFFTTKPVGKGTGLGLAISHSIIVEQHKGQLLCHSRVGEGTEFVMEIPVRQLQGF